MKKSRMKEKIAELERSVHIWKAAFQSTSEELAALKAEVTAFAKGRQCDGNVLAAIAGQPSVTVTATKEEDAPLAEMATLALRMGWLLEPTQADREALYRDGLARGLTSAEAFERAKIGEKAWDDLAGKLFDAMPVTPDGDSRAPDYMRQIDVPVPHQPTHGEKVYYPEGCPPRTLFNPELINEYFRGKPTGEDVASWVIDALNFAVPSVAWCGAVGKIRDLNGEFKYRPWSSSHFVIGYDGKELGLFVSTPHGFKKSTERRIMTSGEG